MKNCLKVIDLCLSNVTKVKKKYFNHFEFQVSNISETTEALCNKKFKRTKVSQFAFMS